MTRLSLALVVGATALSLAPGASAAVRQVDRVLDLDNTDAKLLGPRETITTEEDPIQTLAGGDMNLDGQDDVVVTSARGAQVLYGPVPSSVFDMATVGPGRGFYVADETVVDGSFRDSALGDVTGNGDADLVLGAPNTTAAGRYAAGSVYVITASQNIDLGDGESLNGQGFLIVGAEEFDRAGEDVAVVDDMNGDGRDEILVGAPRRNAAYLVFGKSDTATVDLRTLGTRGFRLNGVPSDGSSYGDQNAGVEVASAGDVNGDGRGDMLVGASAADLPSGLHKGKVYVVFGKVDTGNFDLARIGTINFPGYTIVGEEDWGYFGASIAKAGDMNRDGIPDAVIGAPWADELRGKAYVVFGKTSNAALNAGDLGSGGFEIAGAPLYSGVMVSGGRNLGGDGRTDVVFGARFSLVSGNVNAGSTYVVFGKSGGGAVDLSDLGKKRGYRANRGPEGYESGAAVLASRNLFGRAAPDLLVGAPREPAAGRNAAGVTYLVDEVPPENVDLIHQLEIDSPVVQGASVRLRASAKREAKLRFRLRARARVTLLFMRKEKGRKAGTIARGRCVKPSKAPPGRPACTRLVKAGKIVRDYDGSGGKSLTLTGKAGTTKLAPGRYLLVLSARGKRGRRGGPGLVDFRVKAG